MRAVCALANRFSATAKYGLCERPNSGMVRVIWIGSASRKMGVLNMRKIILLAGLAALGLSTVPAAYAEPTSQAEWVQKISDLKDLRDYTKAKILTLKYQIKNATGAKKQKLIDKFNDLIAQRDELTAKIERIQDRFLSA